MKIITSTIYPAFALVAFACFALAQLVNAQCPQICDGSSNTALGDNALVNNISVQNTAIGWSALESNTTGIVNTATGFQALLRNTTGSNNTATGDETLEYNTTGSNNTATGGGALLFSTTGGANTATGVEALFANTSGGGNTATGYSALAGNTTGSGNTATGIFALSALITTGFNNTATGGLALGANSMGNNNTAAGYQALSNNTTGNNNIALGYQAGFNLTSGNNNIDIGHVGVAGESRTIRIGTTGTQGKTFIAGISGATVASGVGVIVGSNGQLGTVVSSARFKDAIKPMDKASEAILALHPVTFRYKHELDPDGIPQFGLVAEDVEKVNPDLVARDADGKPYTVRYEAVNAMLLNEFLKEHRKGQEQDAMIKQLKTESAQQQKQIRDLSAQIQKVSAQLELSKPAPRTVLNNR